jgi:hypothetical protein
MLIYLKNIFSPKKSIQNTTFLSNTDIDRLNFRGAIKRLVKFKKGKLIFDPFLFMDIKWVIENKTLEFKQIIQSYYPSAKLTLNMPKSKFSFRPVTYLLPIDTVMYQAIVDQIINYKREKFSRFVYSHIINKIDNDEVFDEPIKHWKKMRDVLRKKYYQGNNHYFFCDISGYFENIKLNTLKKTLQFYVGRNETSYLLPLFILLDKWCYADSQGLIQTHNASSILSKIYLSQIDSKFSDLKDKYARYVDEFHFITDDEMEIYRLSLVLNEELREPGLNLNTAKSKYLFGEKILEELDEEKEFFDAIEYHTFFTYEYAIAYSIIVDKWNSLVSDFNNGQEINLKIFRFCIHKFHANHDPCGIKPAMSILIKYPMQTVDIIRYLSSFTSENEYSEFIISGLYGMLRDSKLSLYPWQSILILALLFDSNNDDIVDLKFHKEYFLNKNNDALLRSISIMIITKYSEDYDLQELVTFFRNENDIIVKRTLLFCLKKLPSTINSIYFDDNPTDDQTITITKMFLRNNGFDFDRFVLLQNNPNIKGKIKGNIV